MIISIPDVKTFKLPEHIPDIKHSINETNIIQNGSSIGISLSSRAKLR